MSDSTGFRLGGLPYCFRLGIALSVLTLLGGYVVSGLHLQWHYDNRDESPGLTMNDIRGHYAGVNVPSPLLGALERGHPETQSEASRKVLIDWLKGDRISEDYDSLDLGDLAPAAGQVEAFEQVEDFTDGPCGDRGQAVRAYEHVTRGPVESLTVTGRAGTAAKELGELLAHQR